MHRSDLGISVHSAPGNQANDLLTAQVDSSVGLDEPLFQPFPPQVTFHNAEAFKSHEAVLYLRNNDKVS